MSFLFCLFGGIKTLTLHPLPAATVQYTPIARGPYKCNPPRSARLVAFHCCCLPAGVHRSSSSRESTSQVSFFRLCYFIVTHLHHLSAHGIVIASSSPSSSTKNRSQPCRNTATLPRRWRRIAMSQASPTRQCLHRHMLYRARKSSRSCMLMHLQACLLKKRQAVWLLLATMSSTRRRASSPSKSSLNKSSMP